MSRAETRFTQGDSTPIFNVPQVVMDSQRDWRRRIISAWAETCPACRGYDLERRWCAHCNGTGQRASRKAVGDE